jgi:hypothetical protein
MTDGVTSLQLKSLLFDEFSLPLELGEVETVTQPYLNGTQDDKNGACCLQ